MRCLITAVIALCLFGTSAQAHHHHTKLTHVTYQSCLPDNSGRIYGCVEGQETSRARYSRSGHIEIAGDYGSDPRPRLWCAWWLRRHLNIPKSAFPPYQYNMARAFAHIGTPAPQGCTGCIAVFSRGGGGHVGLVESWDANGNPVILSVNYNGTVGTYAHSRSRLIALRYWA